MSLARDIVDRIFFPNRDVHAIPVLDGGFSPNKRLDAARTLVQFEKPDGLAAGPDGRLYVSAGSTVFACSGDGFGTVERFAGTDGPAGALAWTPNNRLLVAVEGRGVHAFEVDGKSTGILETVERKPLRCVTGLAVAADGMVYATEGSDRNVTGDWLVDLMQNRKGRGRLVVCDEDLSEGRTVQGGLSWPAGVAVAHDEAEILVTEAWSHRLSAVSRPNGAVRVLKRNFAGYPGRIVRGSAGDYWVAFFALRTQLTEFVLRETSFRVKMMDRVPPELWIGPSLGDHVDYREPTQVGRIKKLGIQKPWAPARSYGLIARIDGDGEAHESLHSRVSGHLHGITAAAEIAGRLYVLSRGHGQLAVIPLSAVEEGGVA
ncbi:hypothetical protein [Oceanibacterium hippocampi]|uniref:NHL repeat protein n=1 Tax=Oceanibacterium hippocampi TaxID=745714 RepID=A0A1Y5TYG8_9PROT|nr:hypothetical protein [Oceanibacterium hippocampi]SLN76539.1 NHL repeat protein [Oceanibacterium hippocampi]